MWDEDGETQDNMIEIIYALYFIKTRSWLFWCYFYGY
jgi:hypothetical protein